MRLLDLASGLVTTLAGGVGGVTAGFVDGVGSAAGFWYPWGVAMDSAGTMAVVVRPVV